MKYTAMASPIGELIIAGNGQAITEMHIEEDRYFSGVPDSWEYTSTDPLLGQATAELQEYFEGQRKTFTFPLESGGTSFQEEVWKALRAVPIGQTVTYGEIAAAIGRPKAVRAVGTAVGRNPLCILVPCHRVLTSDGALGGFVAGPARKAFLLRLEGARQ
jgi:methylated-DNA-[protein]-cysteine S-methyltransferase